MVNPHFSRWSHCFQAPVGWIAPCGVGCTGRGHVQCLQCRSTCQRGLRGDHWGLSQFKGPGLMWEQNLKQSQTGVFCCYMGCLFCYMGCFFVIWDVIWHPSFFMFLFIYGMWKLWCVFTLIHSIPKRFWLAMRLCMFWMFFDESFPLETNGPL